MSRLSRLRAAVVSLMRAANRAVPTVLVADGHHDCADSLAMLLRVWGYDVEIAYDTDAAVRRAEARHPDVVLAEPRLDGPHLAERLRLESPSSVLVAVTTRCGPTEEGFDFCLRKPVNPLLLGPLLDAVVERGPRG